MQGWARVTSFVILHTCFIQHLPELKSVKSFLSVYWVTQGCKTKLSSLFLPSRRKDNGAKN